MCNPRVNLLLIPSVAAASFLMAGCASLYTPPVYVTDDLRIQSHVYSHSAEATFKAAEGAVSALNWKILESNPAGLYMVVKPPLDFWTTTAGNALSGGDRLKVWVIPIMKGRTKVKAEMETGETYDRGRIPARLKEFFSKLDGLLQKSA